MKFRTLTLALSLFACLGLSSGCIFVDSGPGAGTSRPIAGSYLIAPIQIGAFAPDPGFAGYIITANAGSYRITWAGYREFRGSVWIKSGTPQFVAGCQDGACSLNGSEDSVVLGSEAGRVDFISFPSSGKRSGFDLLFSGDLVLDLLVDGRRDASRVGFVSGVNGQFSSAPGMPFGLTM